MANSITELLKEQDSILIKKAEQQGKRIPNFNYDTTTSIEQIQATLTGASIQTAQQIIPEEFLLEELPENSVPNNPERTEPLSLTIESIDTTAIDSTKNLGENSKITDGYSGKTNDTKDYLGKKNDTSEREDEER